MLKLWGNNMVIKIGDDPQGRKDLNKYLEENSDGSCDGWRGTVLAFNKDHTEAIIDGSSREGLLLVKEINPNEYPRFVKVVKEIPTGWELVKIKKKTKAQLEKENLAIHNAMEYEKVVNGLMDLLSENEENIKSEDGINISHKKYIQAMNEAVTHYI